MAYGDIGSIIDSEEFDETQGVDCWGIKVSGNVYAVVYQGPSNWLWVTTLEISDAGQITDTIIDTQSFSTSWGVLPHIVHIAGDVFAIVYQGTNYHGTLKTISIASNGTIGSVIDTEFFNAANTRAPKIIRISGNIFAVSFLETASWTNKVKTYEISDDGATITFCDTIDLTASGSYYTSMAKVNETILAIQYMDTVNGCIVATIEIDGNGNITNVICDTQIITPIVQQLAQGITEAWPGVFIVAHVGTDSDGFISSVTIDAAGNISSVIETQEICIVDASEMNIIHLGEGVCAVIFRSIVLVDGVIITIETGSAGEIANVIIDTLDVETASYVNGMLLHLTGDIYGAFYGGPGTDGWLKTLDISTPPPGIPHHELLMGIG